MQDFTKLEQVWKVFYVCIVALGDTNVKPKWERYNICFFVGSGVVHMGSPATLGQRLGRKTHVKENMNAQRRLVYATQDHHANNAVRRSVYASVDQNANNANRRIVRSHGKHKGYALATAYFVPLRMKASVMFPRVTLRNVI